MVHKSLLAAALIVLFLAACSPAPGQPASPSGAAAGKELFAANCGECHSEDGSGTDEAPAVLGHTVEQVKQQVRNPTGDMEAISPETLSDADLALIADFVAGLGGGDAHPDIEPTAEERVHLEAAFAAIEDYENMDRPSAISHFEQAIALASGDSAALYEELLDSIKAEKAGVARHELKELLGMEAEQ